MGLPHSVEDVYEEFVILLYKSAIDANYIILFIMLPFLSIPNLLCYSIHFPNSSLQ